MQSYIYFYPLNSSSEIPNLLLQCISKASRLSSNLIFAGPESYKQQLSRFDNIQFFAIDEGQIKRNKNISTYLSLLSKGLIRSNHPPTKFTASIDGFS